MTTATTLLTLDSDPAQVDDLISRLFALCRDAGLDDLAAYKFTTAINEAVNNIIKHGYRGESGHPIRLHWGCVDDSIQVEIRDLAQPPPAGFLDHAVMPVIAAESGRGCRVIREWTDSARYTRVGNENVLNLKWRR